MSQSEVQPTHPNWDTQYPHVGVKANTFMGDPRINQKQMDAIAKACEADPQALVMGMDENNRPVIRARVGIPRTSRSWAINRQGDPTDAGRIFEVWGTDQPLRITGNRPGI